MTRVGVVGTVMIDHLLFSAPFASRPPQKRTSPPALMRVLRAYETTGGKGYVAARALQFNGVDPFLCAAVKDKSIMLETWPADLSKKFLLPILDRTPRNWIVLHNGDEISTYALLGAPQAVPAEQIEAFLHSIDILYVSYETPSIVSSIIDIMYRVRKSQPAIITNACMAMMLELPVKTLVTLLSRTNTLLLNETEFAYLNERVGPVEEIVSRGCEMIVTKGARGGSFKLGRSPSWHDFEPVVVQQTKSLVGAGDTFAGAYVACRYVHRYDPPTAIAQASALASQCVASSQSAIM